MKKVAVVYWSGTGNTEAMAQAVVEGVSSNGGEGVLIEAGSFGPDKIDDFDAIAFGCPSMGAEELEEEVFKPMWDACMPKLGGKPIALFGSYGWGDGEWMRLWDDECKSAGLNQVTEYVMCNETPDDDAVEACQGLGAALAM